MRINGKGGLGRRVICAATAAILVGALCIISGCTVNNCVKLGFFENGNSNSWKASYTYLDGSTCRNMTAPDGKTTLQVELTTEEGEVDISIVDSEGNKLYSGTDLGNATFGVEAAGKVTVTVIGHKHKGSFGFSY